MGSVRNSNQDDCSLQDISFSHIESTKEQTAKQADFYHNAGWEARKRQDFHAAIEFYTKAIECNSNHFKAYFNRGFAYDRIGEVNKAIADYSRALQIDPYNAYCYYNRGISYDKKGLS